MEQTELREQLEKILDEHSEGDAPFANSLFSRSTVLNAMKEAYFLNRTERIKEIECFYCNGSGRVPELSDNKCINCNGYGKVLLLPITCA